MSLCIRWDRAIGGCCVDSERLDGGRSLCVRRERAIGGCCVDSVRLDGGRRLCVRENRGKRWVLSRQ